MTAHCLAALTDHDLVDTRAWLARATSSRFSFAVTISACFARRARSSHPIDEAEDVVQQTWLEIFRHLSQFRGDAQFTTWATRICVNAALAQSRASDR